MLKSEAAIEKNKGKLNLPIAVFKRKVSNTLKLVDVESSDCIVRRGNAVKLQTIYRRL